MYIEQAVQNFPKKEAKRAKIVKMMASYYDIAVIKSFWQKLLKVIMNYLTLDGHYTRVYGHHFVILNHFRHGVRMSFPFYLMLALRANFSDHHKNPSKFPILHEGLLVLIDAHFRALPPPDDYIHIVSENDETSLSDFDNEASGSGSEEISPPLKKAKIEIPLTSKPKVRKGIKGKKKIVMSSPLLLLRMAPPLLERRQKMIRTLIALMS